ncbi:MAG: hypothetical protein J1D89_03150, partial [Agathobacter sp.]|nr:hypothetical protein [Agathobacter sp.]
MKKLFRFAAFALSAVCALSCAPATVFADEANVEIDLNTTYQTIDGFGASYTWYSDWLPSNDHAEQGYDWIFGDAEFNILRFRDLHDVTAANESQLARNGYKAYRGYYDAAVARGIDPLVLVTSWGQYRRDLPFVAFTEIDDEGHTYYTLAKNADGEYMYDELADFCVESIQLFFDAGIPVHYFSISNETELQGTGKDENGNARNEAGFFFGSQENEYHCAYWKAHVAVYEAFQKAFGDKAPSITGAEVMADTSSLMNKYINYLQYAAPDSVEMVAHHLYGSANTPRSFKEVSDRYYGKYKLWQTEYYLNDYIKQAEMMANEFIYENINAYLYWNGVWIEDDGNCLIEIAGYDRSKEIYRRGNHYIMMHFSKYIKRGYQRVKAANKSNSTVVAFKSPDHTKLVIVAVNRTDSEDSLTFDLGDEVTVKDSLAFRTIGAENRDDFQYWLDADKYSEEKNVLPPMSVTTYVLDIDAPAPVVPETQPDNDTPDSQ